MTRLVRIAAITGRAEFGRHSRVVNGVIRLAMQLMITICLWRGLYAYSADSGGIPLAQAVTYAVMGMLLAQNGGIDRFFSRDSAIQHIQQGSIVYWFLRPLPARHYYTLRAVGDRLYCLGWGVVGYVPCLVSGFIAPPASGVGGVLFGLSLVGGQIILHYLVMLLDLVCFWSTVNSSAVNIYQFLLNLFSGAIAPLWFFPSWFTAVNRWLPFDNIIHAPLSFYVGRFSSAQAATTLAGELTWIAVLAVVTRLMWSRAQDRLNIQGG